MFSTQQALDMKTGSEGVGRLSFLDQLVNEFKKTNQFQAKCEVLANLANFAYDPINYEFLRKLRVLDLFLEQLSQNSEKLLNFGLAGLCNLSADPENREYILRLNGVHLISQHLLHKNEDIALNALTTLFFLYTAESQSIITTPEIISKVLHYKDSTDARFRNLATIFLNDFCTPEQISHAVKFAQ